MSSRIRVPDHWPNIIQEYKDLGLDIPKVGTAIEDTNLKEVVTAERTLKEEKIKSRNATSKIDVLNKEIKEYKKIIDTIENIRTNDVEQIKIRSTSKHSEATAVIVASDWHLEERVDPETIAGIDNEYSPTIAQKRAGKFFNEIVNNIRMFENKYVIKNAVFAVLGDLISGYIHDELEESNYLSPLEACNEVKKILISGIEFLKKNTDLEKITIPCCHGNHGRTQDKKRVSTSWKNSFEYWLYVDLAEKYKDDERIDIIVTKGYHVYVNVYDYIVRFHHGDNIRYAGGVGGINIPANKAVDSWNSIRHADLDVFGHFHQLKDDGRFISNGSLIGYNAYALSIKARYEPPQQAFFIIDKDYGKTTVAPIRV